MRAVVAFSTLAGSVFLAEPASGDIVCPDSSYVEVDYACTFTGSYRNGEPKDVVTVSPTGNGETLAENGISIRVYLRNCQGEPVVGSPAEAVRLVGDYFCVCPGGNIADGPTDELGRTTFSGTLRAGGCAHSLYLEVEGVIVTSVPVRTNSPDDVFQAPCTVDSGELSLMAARLGSQDICLDFNEDGCIDVSDFAEFVSRYFTLVSCPSLDSPVASRNRALRSTDSAPVAKIGIFADPEGRSCSKVIRQGDSGELWVLALLEDGSWPPIVGAEFGFAGYPGAGLGRPLVFIPNGLGIVDLLFGGVVMAFLDPKPVEGCIFELFKITYSAQSDVPTTKVRIVGSAIQSNPSFDGPVLIAQREPSSCVQSPQYEVIPAIGLEFVINGECTIAVDGTTWQQVKGLYRD